MNLPSSPHRPIRSFVRREGRMTDAQRRAFETLLPKFAVPEGGDAIDFARLFGRAAPLHVEIGFGNGDALAAMATAHPENNYLGIEVHRPGVGALLRRVESAGLENVRVACGDVVPLLQRVPDNSLAAIYLFFPDPWPKKRHHKRRLVQPPFVALLTRKLSPGGSWFLATDWQDYALHMLAVLSGEAGLENAAPPPGAFAGRPALRPATRFERRGQRLGHAVWDLVYRRRGQA